MIFQIHKLILILIRMTTFIVVVPGFSYRGIPNTLKIAISGVLSVFIYSTAPELVIEGGLMGFSLLVIKEAIFGLTLGFVVQLLFSAIETAGKLIDFQVGFAMGAVYDPAMGAQASNYGRLYYWLAIAIFFVLDMHNILLLGIMGSFELIPLGSANIYGTGTESMVIVFAEVFEIGINLAAPMIITVLITDVVLGVISRTVPQINVFMLGMPMKSMISFFVFLISLVWVMNYSGEIMGTIPNYMEGFMHLFGSKG